MYDHGNMKMIQGKALFVLELAAEYTVIGREFDLMQSTGLVDKNNTVVFEKDILLDTLAATTLFFVIGDQGEEESCGCCSVVYGYDLGQANPDYIKDSCIVVGNMHENGHLIEKEERAPRESRESRESREVKIPQERPLTLPASFFEVPLPGPVRKQAERANLLIAEMKNDAEKEGEK